MVAGGAMAAGVAFPTRGLAAGVPSERLDSWLRLMAQGTPVSLEDYTPAALTSDELATLRAVVGRLIPTDDLGPGADEAGVHVFIDRGLAGPYAETLPIYQSGLAALAKGAGSGGFASAATDKQDDLLTQAEGNMLADAPEGFFALLLEHTRQGMFGDPIYGGNRDFAGWDLIGYAGIKLVWTPEDQEINAQVAPEHISVAKYGGQGW
jgi:gluconate 2-dehydrogenase gamma chain